MIHNCIWFIESVLPFQEIRNGVTQKGETLSWLKSRLKILVDVSSEKEAQMQGDELAKLSSSFKALGTLLSEVCHLHSKQFWVRNLEGSFSLVCNLKNNFIKKF